MKSSPVLALESPSGKGPMGDWVSSESDKNLNAIVRPVRAPTNFAQVCAKFVVEGEQYESRFSAFIIFCIIVAGILVGLQTYPVLETDPTIALIDLFVLAMFCLEVVLKIGACDAKPHLYWIGDDWKWNNFDFIIVVLSLFDTSVGGLPMPVSFLRLLRLARILKLVKKVRGLQVIVMGLAGGLSSILYIMLLLALLFYLYAIMGILAFRQNDYWHFKDIGTAFLTLFRAATLEDWTDIMYINIFGCEDYGGGIYDNNSVFSMYHCENAVKNPVLSPIYWTTFIIIAAMIMMSLFVGAITMAMTESMDKMKKEKAEEAEEEMATLKEKQNGDRKVQGSEKRNSEKAPTSPESAMSYQELRKISTKRRMCELLNIHWSGSRGSQGALESDRLTKRYPKGFFGKYYRFREACLILVRRPFVINLITYVILFAGVVVGIQTDVKIMRSSFGLYVLPIVDYTILGIFTIEVILKLLGEGIEEFSRSGWNRFDFIVVLGGLINILQLPAMDSIGGLITMFRLLRLLRVLRVVKRVPQLTIIVDALTTGLGSIGFIGVILFLVFYIFAIVGIIFFRDNDPWHFGNLQMAMLTLFRVATLEDWSDVLYTNIFGCGRYGYDDEMFGKLYFAPTFPCDTDAEISGFMAGVAVIYFVIFVVIGALVLLTLFVGVVCTAMEDATENQNEEKRVNQRLEEFAVLKNIDAETIEAYKEFFLILDENHSGRIEVSEFCGLLLEFYEHLSGDEIDAWIKDLDKNEENQIDVAELVMLLHRTGTQGTEENVMTENIEELELKSP